MKFSQFRRIEGILPGKPFERKESLNCCDKNRNGLVIDGINIFILSMNNKFELSVMKKGKLLGSINQISRKKRYEDYFDP